MSKTLLIVENEHIVREIIKEFFTGIGVEAPCLLK